MIFLMLCVYFAVFCQDLSAFAMPLLESDQQDGLGATPMDLDSTEGRPRSGSGSNFKLFGGKSRQRNKSGEESPAAAGKNNGASPTSNTSTSSKMKSFFDTFRPRSKSDVSGLKKPGKKNREAMGVSGLAMDRSMDESTLAHQGGAGVQYVPGFKSPVDPISPMGQILEGQMMGDAGGGDSRMRHKSGGVGGYEQRGFRTRSNSDSRARSALPPRRPHLAQVCDRMRDKEGHVWGWEMWQDGERGGL